MSKINEHEYKFLKGDKVHWPCWGAALGVVSEWCKNKGYGEFGKPTDSGRKVMEEFEMSNPHLW